MLVKKKSNPGSILVLIIIFLAAFRISWGFGLGGNSWIFSPLHELGHVFGAVLTGGGGKIMEYWWMMSSGGDPLIIQYSGTYGQVFFLTLFIVICSVMGTKLYFPVFCFGGILPVITELDPVYTYMDWLGASRTAIISFIIYFFCMVVISLAALLYLAIKWYFPQYYEEIPAISKFKKEVRKQAGTDYKLTKKGVRVYN